MTDDERLKLVANWLNDLATALFTVGALIPAGQLIFNIPPQSTDNGLVVGVGIICIIFGLGIHLVGHFVLGELQCNREWSKSGWSNREWSKSGWSNREWSKSDWSNREWSKSDWSNREWSKSDWNKSDWSKSDWNKSDWNKSARVKFRDGTKAAEPPNDKKARPLPLRQLRGGRPRWRRSCDGDQLMTADAITEGAKAWDRFKSRSRKDWADWLSVGHALLLGRIAVMKIANTNKPAGSTYNRVMGHWLLEHGFDGINNQERYRAILVFENRAEIEAWRNGLDEAKRRRINHPNAAWALWRRAMRPVQSPAPTPRHVVVSN